MKTLFSLILFMCMVIALFSCTEKVDLDPREREIVVYSILGDSTTQKVQLFYTSYISENYYPPVTEAQVYIEQLNDTVIISRNEFYKVEDGLWQANFQPDQLGIYRITINIPNRDTITATTQFPLRLKLYDYWKEHGPYNYSSVSKAQTKASMTNYMPITLFSLMAYNPSTGSYYMAPELSLRDHFSNREDQDYWKEQTWLFKDFKYAGKYAIYRYGRYVSAIDSLNFAAGTISKVHACVTLDDLVITDINVHASNITKYWDKISIGRTLHPLSYFVVESINEDYELYIKDIIAKSLEDESDLTLLWKKDNIYSNIKNGLGIFAAKCRYELMVKDWQDGRFRPTWEEYGIIIPGWND